MYNAQMPEVTPAVEALIARAEADCAAAFHRMDEI